MERESQPAGDMKVNRDFEKCTLLVSLDYESGYSLFIVHVCG